MNSTQIPATGRSRERLYRANVIVLRRLDYSETDRIYSVLSERQGKFSIIAKGVRRPASKIGPHLELLATTQLLLARGRDLDVVSGAELIDSHLRLRTDLAAFGMASHCAEITDRFLADRDPNPPVHSALVGVLGRLDRGDSPDIVGRWYEVFLLEKMGVRPELYQCVVCERPVEESPNSFSSRLGGVLCQEHACQDTAAPVLSVAAQKVLRLMMRGSLDSLTQLRIGPETSAELRQTLLMFIRTQLDRDLTSLNVARRVEETLPDYDHTSTK